MLVLGIDTATDICAIGLIDGKKLLGELNVCLHHRHSERLINNIDYLLKEAGYTVKDLEGAAVGLGPGSFTGLRIGLTTIKTFVQVLDIKVAGISTLDIIAGNISQNEGWLLPVIEAGRQRVYTALYRGNSNLLQAKEWDDMVIEVAELLDKLEEIDKKGPFYAAGNGVNSCKDVFAQSSLEFIYTSVSQRIPRGSIAAELGHNLLETGRGEDYHKLVPNYLKKARGNF